MSGSCQAVLKNETSEKKKLSVSFFVWMVRSDEKMFWEISDFFASCKLNGIHSANFVRQQCQALQHHVAPIFRTRMKSKIFLSGSPFGVRPSRYLFLKNPNSSDGDPYYQRCLVNSPFLLLKPPNILIETISSSLRLPLSPRINRIPLN